MFADLCTHTLSQCQWDSLKRWDFRDDLKAGGSLSGVCWYGNVKGQVKRCDFSSELLK